MFDTLIAARYVENPRAVNPEDVAAAIESLGGRVAAIAADPAEALAAARRFTAGGGLICITGSLFLAAEARALVLGHAPAPAGRVLT
jgi:dihydrofolate synthase/folylpolyglutamate synthase